MCDAAQPEGRKDNAMYLDLRSLTTSAQCVAWTPILPNTHLTYRWVVGGNSPLISLNDIILWRNHTRYRSIITLTAHRNKQTSEYLSYHAHSPLSSLNNFLARKIIEIIDWLLRAQILKGYLIKSTNFLSDISFVNGMAYRGNFIYFSSNFPHIFLGGKTGSRASQDEEDLHLQGCWVPLWGLLLMREVSSEELAHPCSGVPWGWSDQHQVQLSGSLRWIPAPAHQ